ncbi:MAG: GDSL-type esterase/lipase family protein [Kiritimatiellia bacterium]
MNKPYTRTIIRKALYRIGLLLFAGILCSCNPFDSGSGGGSGSGPQTVLVLGDSISGVTNYPGVPPWPTLIAGMQPEWTLVNRASSRERIAGGRAKVQSALQSAQPDVLVVFYGTNNAIMGDTAGFEGDLRAIIQAGKNAGARVAVCTVPTMYGARRIYNGRISEINSIIRTTAPAEGATVVDIFKELGTDNPDMFPDGIHPDLDGQRIIAIAVAERI